MSHGNRARASTNWVAALAVLAAACSGGEGPKDAVADRIDEIAESAISEGPIAGLSIAVVRGQDVVVSKGYGYADLDAKLPATADTIYDIASVTKLFTAAASNGVRRNLPAQLEPLPDPFGGRPPAACGRGQRATAGTAPAPG